MQVSQTQHRYIHKQEYTCPMINILTKLDTQQKDRTHVCCASNDGGAPLQGGINHANN
jgi:hypothetical protein